MVTQKEMDSLPKIAAIDFDGCLVYDQFPEIGPINKELFACCKNLKKNGVKLILWTSRNGRMLQNAVNFCKENGLEFDAVNENLPEVVNLFGGDTRKVYADIYIDDKSIPHHMAPVYWKERVGIPMNVTV